MRKFVQRFKLREFLFFTKNIPRKTYTTPSFFNFIQTFYFFFYLFKQLINYLLVIKRKDSTNERESDSYICM